MYNQAICFIGQALFTLVLVGAFLDPHRHCLSERLAETRKSRVTHEYLQKELNGIRKSIPKINIREIREIRAGEGVALSEKDGVVTVSVTPPPKGVLTDTGSVSVRCHGDVHAGSSGASSLDLNRSTSRVWGTSSEGHRRMCSREYESTYMTGCGGGTTGKHYPNHKGCETEKVWKGREAKEHYLRRGYYRERWSWATLADGTVVCQDKWHYLICEHGICERTLGNHSGANHEFKFPERAR